MKLPPDSTLAPPTRSALSTTRTDAPRSAAVTAADRPAAPDPTTTTSTSGMTTWRELGPDLVAVLAKGRTWQRVAGLSPGGDRGEPCFHDPARDRVPRLDEEPARDRLLVVRDLRRLQHFCEHRARGEQLVRRRGQRQAGGL